MILSPRLKTVDPRGTPDALTDLWSAGSPSSAINHARTSDGGPPRSRSALESLDQEGWWRLLGKLTGCKLENGNFHSWFTKWKWWFFHRRWCTRGYLTTWQPIHTCHGEIAGGHRGILWKFGMVSKWSWWKGLKSDVPIIGLHYAIELYFVPLIHALQELPSSRPWNSPMSRFHWQPIVSPLWISVYMFFLAGVCTVHHSIFGPQFTPHYTSIICQSWKEQHAGRYPLTINRGETPL